MSKTAVLLVIDTDDPRLRPDQRTQATLDAMQQAIFEALPSCLTHVLACMTELEAALMVALFDEQAQRGPYGKLPAPPDGYQPLRFRRH